MQECIYIYVFTSILARYNVAVCACACIHVWHCDYKWPHIGLNTLFYDKKPASN